MTNVILAWSTVPAALPLWCTPPSHGSSPDQVPRSYSPPTTSHWWCVVPITNNWVLGTKCQVPTKVNQPWTNHGKIHLPQLLLVCLFTDYPVPGPLVFPCAHKRHLASKQFISWYKSSYSITNIIYICHQKHDTLLIFHYKHDRFPNKHDIFSPVTDMISKHLERFFEYEARLQHRWKISV